ncbi:methyltransferase [Roseovarius salis]|uniref:class I SAM-dependent methyltransferase n=1 Tax=Roseovarius salis TaxID=3376063 RepID=UPI0037C66341
MDAVKDQYEAFPYPERDPADESRRLITGSPSLPQEIDHFLFGGQRDWSRPLRILVAGGGTGDGLIQLTALLSRYGKPYRATYIDLSAASRRVAEARAAARGLGGITFVTGSLLDAADHGPFDYIDCCGVLHHLPDPAAGFRALRAALAPGGGMGFMVYAPYGRSGVYPLQQAFAALFGTLEPRARLDAARRVYENLPAGHPFKTNPNVHDHENGDAGFYDLLLHTQDRAYDVAGLVEVLDETGWALSGFTVPAPYDLSRFGPVPEGMSEVQKMALAEKLNGTIRTHTAYAAPKEDAPAPASGRNRALVPHLKGVQAAQLAQAAANGHAVTVSADGVSAALELPKGAARAIAAIDGRRSIADIAALAGDDPIAFGAAWAGVERALAPWGMLLYSSVLR